MIKLFILDDDGKVEYSYTCEDFKEAKKYLLEDMEYTWIEEFYRKKDYYREPIRIVAPDATVIEVDKMDMLRTLSRTEYLNRVVIPFVDSVIENAERAVAKDGFYDKEKYFSFERR